MTEVQIAATLEVMDLLHREAALLDAGELEQWLTLLTTDIEYRVPVRATRYGTSAEEFSTRSFHFNEDLYSLTMRVKRLQTRFAWAEDPPTRSRHMVSNVRVLAEDDGAGDLSVASNVLLLRTRFDDGRTELLSGDRRDVLRRVDGELLLARRTVYLDQTTLAMSSITTFL
jgi:3-phenylpropionate/cinnamic acid dioxygenase small subunit